MGLPVRSLALVLLSLAWSGQLANLPPPSGRLVDVGGRKLHLICTGSGSPTVVFEAGASSFAIDFSLVQAEMARTIRVCSDHRIGHGWSDPSSDKDPDTVTTLHGLLQTAGEKPPFVLAGASRGGTARPAIRRALPGRGGRPGPHRPHARGTAVHPVQRGDRRYRFIDRRTASIHLHARTTSEDPSQGAADWRTVRSIAARSVQDKDLAG